MTNADRLAELCGWEYHPTPTGRDTRPYWTREVGERAEMTFTHPMSTLDAVAGSLPPGVVWDSIEWTHHYVHAACCGATNHDTWRASSPIVPNVNVELDARIAASLAAWEVSSGK